jgi:ribose transport system substrate-binding protein
VVAWPMNDIDAFRDTVEIYNNELKTHKKIIIIGVGKILPSYKALLKEHLVHAYVSIDFFEMGRETYRNMKKAANGESIAKTTYTKNEIVRSNSILENTTKKAATPIDK